MKFKLLVITTLFVCSYSINIGFLTVATGNYIKFINPLLSSARKNFCKEHKLTFFVFTDSESYVPDKDIVKVYQKRLGWPHDTLMRFHIYLGSQERYREIDYLFACDADMLIAQEVGSEIIGKRVAVRHPGFLNKRGSYEQSKKSTAAVRSNEGKYYFAGGCCGGYVEDFLHMCKSISNNIDIDLKNNIIAVWHDESHLNRYFIDFEPTKILYSDYCAPESWNVSYSKKIIALDKNHAEERI